ncbi:hypothetical protein [Roseomonas sp. BN140053]|uniref:hypothetical protein n=1 Tax=Roseomonas sp. BN140053 TaxID=3391898 RepID=UPI0039EA24B5
MNVQTAPQARAPHVNTATLICGTLVSRDLKRVRHMLEGAFGLQCVQPEPGLLLARDRGFEQGGPKRGQPYWVLEIREVEEIAVEQEMLNHWGMAAPSEAAVDEAYAKLNAAKAEYGIARVQKPRFRNGSYACYFIDEDSNWWELEYRSPDLTYEVLRAKGDLHHD